MRIASVLSAVKPSASMAASIAASAMKADGKDVIDLGLGEPDFDTPPHIIEAAYKAGLDGQTRYTPTNGSNALKLAILDKFERENDLLFETSEVIVSNGAKQVIFNAMMATLEPGDEVLLAAPCFGSYPDIVRILGGKPVFITCDAANGFRLTPKQLQEAITSKTRWLFINSPSNPSGAIYNTQQLRELGDVLAHYPHVGVLSDEIYEHVTFVDDGFISFGLACPELRARTLIVNGVSKAYAMTGWRIGYGAGPADLIQAMTTVQSQATSGASSISQAAAVAALNGPQDTVADFCAAFRERRDLVTRGINQISGLKLDPPDGAFYAYVDCSGWIGRATPAGKLLHNDVDVADELLRDSLIAVVAGAAYGLSPYFRISTATTNTELERAIERLRRFSNRLS